MSAEQKVKTLNLRLPKDLWVFLKIICAENEQSLNNYIIEKLLAAKKKHEKNS